MTHMSAATLRILTARKNKKKEQTHEDYTAIMRRLANRADGERKDLCAGIDKAAEVIRRTSDFLDGSGELLHRQELQKRTMGKPTTSDEQRENLARLCNDLRYAHEPDGDIEHIVKRSCPNYRNDERSHGFNSGAGHGPRAKQEVSSGWSGY